MRLSVLPACYVSVPMCSAFGGQKRVVYLLELELRC